MSNFFSQRRRGAKFFIKYPFFILVIFCNFLIAQQSNIPLNREIIISLDSILNSVDVPFHTNIKPYLKSQVCEYYNYNSFIYGTPSDKKKSLLYRKLFRESFIVIDSSDYHLTIDPLFNLELGKDFKGSSKSYLYKNTRGILVRGDLGKKFSFESSFYENQATFPDYISDFIETYKVVPGQGRVKAFKGNAYDFAMASGYISYSPNNHFNFQIGHGKHFIGDGYRSLLLSDNAFNYPYLRVSSTFGKFQYTNIYTSFMNLGGGTKSGSSELLYQKKSASFQLLSWNIHKRIQLGLFQGMIWQAANQRNEQNLNFYYFNPIILTNFVRYSLNDDNNILLGLNIKVKINNFLLYSQLMYDDIVKDWMPGSLNNKSGWQIGVKYNSSFSNQIIEFNRVRPYSYSHLNPEQSYTHYNQTLAHPLGANFDEIIYIANIRFGNVVFQYKAIIAMIGTDLIGENYGSNIFSSNNTAIYGTSPINQLKQGNYTSLKYMDFSLRYLLNPSTNLNVIAGIIFRSEFNNKTLFLMGSNFIYVGIRTSLSNVYMDF